MNTKKITIACIAIVISFALNAIKQPPFPLIDEPFENVAEKHVGLTPNLEKLETPTKEAQATTFPTESLKPVALPANEPTQPFSGNVQPEGHLIIHPT